MHGIHGFPASELEAVHALVDGLNDEHPDTLALVARVGAAPLDGAEAEITAVDPTGATLAVGPPTSSARPTVRVPFAAAVGSADALRAGLLGALAEARAAVGESVPPTSFERDMAAAATIPMHRAHVISVEVLTPNLLEVELGGLDSFEVLGPDTFAFALVPTGDAPLDDAFTIGDYQQARVDGTIRGAYYTVRHWDAERAVVTFWVLLHGHDDGVASWMCSARPGAELLVWGPRRGFVPPPDADHLLLVADETGLAAVASLIEATEPHVRIDAVVEAVDSSHRPPLPPHPRLTVRWIDRGATPAGTTEELVDVTRTVDMGAGTWAAFGGAESRVATRVRRLVRRERGLPATHVSMTGYWRR